MVRDIVLSFNHELNLVPRNEGDKQAMASIQG